MNGATKDHDPTGARSRACKHHLLVPGNRPTASRRYRRRHCQRDLSGCTPLRPPRLCSRARRREGNGHAPASSAARNDSHTIVRVVVATRRSHHLDVGGPPGGLIDRFDARLLADHQSPSAETGGFLMDNRDCSTLGGHETVAAQRNNTLADIWHHYRQTSPGQIPRRQGNSLRVDRVEMCPRSGPILLGAHRLSSLALSQVKSMCEPRQSRVGCAGDWRLRCRGIV
jgi:hypothetical protein